jgi:hypothetical protein
MHMHMGMPIIERARVTDGVDMAAFLAEPRLACQPS